MQPTSDELTMMACEAESLMVGVEKLAAALSTFGYPQMHYELKLMAVYLRSAACTLKMETHVPHAVS